MALPEITWNNMASTTYPGPTRPNQAEPNLTCTNLA